jgi:hypothetical protein
MRAYVDQHQMMTEFRKALFSRVVPTVKDIGLWGPKVQEAFVDMGVMQFQDLDVHELSDATSASPRRWRRCSPRAANGRRGLTDNGSRGAELADTVAARGRLSRPAGRSADPAAHGRPRRRAYHGLFRGLVARSR